MITKQYRPLKLWGGTQLIADNTPFNNIQRSNFESWVFESVLSGTSYAQIADTTYTIMPGDMYILPQGQDHMIYPGASEACEKIYIQMDGDLMPFLLEEHQLQGVYYFPQVHVKADLAAIISSQSSLQHDSFALQLHTLLIKLRAHHFKLTAKIVPKRIQDMTDYLDAHVEKKISLEDMAHAFYCSKVHLIRQFKEYVGSTPWEYLLQHRLQQAQWLLIHTGTSITSIAERLHFSDVHYFSRFFKNRTSQSPLHFRRKESLYF